jgi:hypothetical protein
MKSIFACDHNALKVSVLGRGSGDWHIWKRYENHEEILRYSG